VTAPDCVVSADEAVAQIADGATIAITGSGGGILEAEAVLAAIERRFLKTGHPCDLTLVHALGIGDGQAKGLNHLAYRGLVKRVIGGHWSWSPRMQQLAADGDIEAYALPAGVIGALLRESGARRPGLFTRVGLGSFVDPRVDGGRLNSTATEDLVTLAVIDGETYLHYQPLKVDVAIVRGSSADPTGNVSLEAEPALLDSDAVALSARGNDGFVIAQVKNLVEEGSLDPRHIHLPSTLVDAVVVDPDQWQTHAAEMDSSFYTSVSSRSSQPQQSAVAPLDAKSIIARRAALEAHPGTLINVGFGMSSLVVDVLAAEGVLDQYGLVIEQGAVGGQPVSGALFGVSRHPSAILTSTRQFDFFGSRSLDICFLGMAEVDQAGNVNASKIGPMAVGPGGFIDIVHGSHRAVFCGPLTAKGLSVMAEDGRLRIEQEGSVHKFIEHVNQITFSASQALTEGRQALFVTERAVFELTPSGIALVEVADGIDIERDVIAHMDFEPFVGDVRPMPSEVFTSGPLLAAPRTIH